MLTVFSCKGMLKRLLLKLVLLQQLIIRICVECVTIQRIRLRKLWRYHANARKRGTCSRVYERKFRRVSSVLFSFQQVYIRLTLYLSSVIAMMRPDESWVGKWQRIGKHPCLLETPLAKKLRMVFGLCRQVYTRNIRRSSIWSDTRWCRRWTWSEGNYISTTRWQRQRLDETNKINMTKNISWSN